MKCATEIGGIFALCNCKKADIKNKEEITAETLPQLDFQMGNWL
jgi:hypothetical protein